MFPCILKKLSFLSGGNTYPAHFMTRNLSSRVAVLLYLSQMKKEIILEATMIQQLVFVLRRTKVPELDFTW